MSIRLQQGFKLMAWRFAANQGLMICANLYVLRHIPMAEFGRLAIANLIVALAQGWCESGLTNALLREPVAVFRAALPRIFRIQMVAILVLISVPCWVLYQRGGVGIVITEMLCCLPLALIRYQLVAISECDLDFTRIALIEIAESLVYPTVLIGAVLAGGGVHAYPLALGSRLSLGIILFLFAGGGSLLMARGSLAPMVLQRAVAAALRMQVPNIINQLRLAANPILVGMLFGLSAVGAYDRAIFLAAIPLSIAATVQNRLLYPVLCRGADKATLVHVNELMQCVTFWVHVAYIILLAVTPLVLAVVQAEMAGAIVIYVGIFAVGNVAVGSWMSAVTPFVNVRGGGGNIAVSIASLLVTWGLTVPLLKLFGDVGYAVVSGLVWLTALSIGVTNQTWNDGIRWVWGNVSYLVAAATLLVLLGFAIQAYLQAGGRGPLLQLLAGTLVLVIYVVRIAYRDFAFFRRVLIGSFF